MAKAVGLATACGAAAAALSGESWATAFANTPKALRPSTVHPSVSAVAPGAGDTQATGVNFQVCPAVSAIAAAGLACGFACNSRRANPRRGARVVRAAAAPEAKDAAAKDADTKDADPEAASAAYREMLRNGKTAAPSSSVTTTADKGWLDDPSSQEDLKAFVTSISVALAFRFTIAEPRFIPSESMVPSFEVGDQLVVDKISKNWREYKRRDVVVFDPPPLYWQVVQREPAGEALIKRIVAIEGDFVEMKAGGILVVNDVEQEEMFTNERASYTMSRRQVPPGQVFCLGDNRNRSLDGHVWGFLPVENIIGRATFNWWPPWHVHTIAAAPE